MAFAKTKPRFPEATETMREETLEPEELSADRWHALDEFLSDSFAMISPAYLFTCFPPSR